MDVTLEYFRNLNLLYQEFMTSTHVYSCRSIYVQISKITKERVRIASTAFT